jgi:hypothetical protein
MPTIIKAKKLTFVFAEKAGGVTHKNFEEGISTGSRV